MSRNLPGILLLLALAVVFGATAVLLREEYDTGLERGTAAPKTASLAVRLRGTRRLLV